MIFLGVGVRLWFVWGIVGRWFRFFIFVDLSRHLCSRTFVFVETADLWKLLMDKFGIFLDEIVGRMERIAYSFL